MCILIFDTTKGITHKKENNQAVSAGCSCLHHKGQKWPPKMSIIILLKNFCYCCEVFFFFIIFILIQIPSILKV